MYPPAPLWGTPAVRVMLSTITVHNHKPADSVLQSVSSVLYPSFNGSPPNPNHGNTTIFFVTSRQAGRFAAQA